EGSVMVKITYIEKCGEAHIVEGNVGESLMEVAVRNAVSGIEAECGGSCACATCHIHIGAAWRPLLSQRGAIEEGLLEFTDNVDESARLSCQIKVTEELDGIVVHVVGKS